MKQDSFLWQAAGFALTTLGGTILHFSYDWTGGNILISPFSGVNESTWEHIKLIQQYFFKDTANYWWVKLAEILLGLVLIPVLFYTYNGAFGKSPDWINIAIFYITALIVFLFERWALKVHCPPYKHPLFGFVCSCIIGMLFFLFTFRPPQIPLFQDPITGAYGIHIGARGERVLCSHSFARLQTVPDFPGIVEQADPFCTVPEESMFFIKAAGPVIFLKGPQIYRFFTNLF